MKKFAKILLCSLLALAIFACSESKNEPVGSGFTVYKVKQTETNKIKGDKDEFYIVLDDGMEFPIACVVKYDTTTQGSEKASVTGTWKECDLDGSFSLYTIANRAGKFVPEHKDDDGETVDPKFTFDSVSYDVEKVTDKEFKFDTESEKFKFNGKNVEFYNGVFFEYVDGTPDSIETAVLWDSYSDRYAAVKLDSTSKVLDEKSYVMLTELDDDDPFCQFVKADKYKIDASFVDPTSMEGYHIDPRNMNIMDESNGVKFVVAKATNCTIDYLPYSMMVGSVTLEGAAAGVVLGKEENIQVCQAPVKLSEGTDSDLAGSYIFVHLPDPKDANAKETYSFANIYYDSLYCYRWVNAGLHHVDEVDSDGYATIFTQSAASSLSFLYNYEKNTLKDNNATTPVEKECEELSNGVLVYWKENTTDVLSTMDPSAVCMEGESPVPFVQPVI